MKIEIKGPIIPDSQQWIYDWLEMPATSPSKVSKLLKQAKDNEEIEIEINSPGGSVFAGSEIYTTLKSYRGNTRGKIVGIAASAASVIAMGVKTSEISPTAQIMIHRSSTYNEGNANDFQKTVDMLQGIDRSIANAYLIKTGIKQEELLNMMSKETWLDAQQAKEMGFVDKIMFEDEIQAVAAADISGMIQDKIVNKIMEKFKDEAEQQHENDKEIELAKAKLNLELSL